MSGRHERPEGTDVISKEVVIPVTIKLSQIEGIPHTHMRSKVDTTELSWLSGEWRMRLCFHASAALAGEGMRQAKQAGVSFEDATQAAHAPYEDGYAVEGEEDSDE